MPELPEVETTLCGIRPHLLQQRVCKVIIRQTQLRWEIPKILPQQLKQQRLLTIHRRAKYLLFQFDNGYLLIHLGMSGSLRIVSTLEPIPKHAHVDIQFDNTLWLRYIDPRRFGAILWLGQDPFHHPLLQHLGLEPFDPAFTGVYLYQKAKGKRIAIKPFIMDQKIVTGVGNIYATEALFHSGIHPARAAGRIAKKRYDTLVTAIQQILQQAIQQGGTTLKDFSQSNGKPGYFTQSLQIYGYPGQPCPRCNQQLKLISLNNRSSVYCPRCQT